MKAKGWRLCGSRYVNGVRYPGFGQVVLDDGKIVYFGESKSEGIECLLQSAEKRGIDVSDMRHQVDDWVRNGGDLVQFRIS
jgi:hypothetical protein